jgi:ubiquinol-cytochrome c reductase cytochrome c subunit
VRRALAVALAVAAALTPFARADPPDAGLVHVPRGAGTSDVQWGKALFGANCVSCHGVGGVGVVHPRRAAGDQQGQGPSLRGVGALAADFYLRTGYMPLRRPDVQPRRSRVLFSDGEIRALVAYVASLGKGPRPPHPHPERGHLSRGFELFASHCAGCHQIVGQGGYLPGAAAPPLGSVTPRQIAEAIRVGPYLMPRFRPSQLSDADVDSIIKYVEYATHRPKDKGGWAIGHIGPVPEGLVAWLIAGAVLVGLCAVIGERNRG